MISLNKFKYPTVSPSVLSMDKDRPGEELALIRKSGFSFVHIDLMDGKFVANTSFSDEFVKKIVSYSANLFNDVHIMVAEPWNEIQRYVSLGADLITFHYEACPTKEKVIDTINAIKKCDVCVGISICPDTDPEVLLPFIDLVDLVLVMSVVPGKGGQKFIPSSLDKIRYLKRIKPSLIVEVDGGINYETSKLVREAGADLIVAGSYLFGHEDFVERAKGLLE